MTETQFSKYLSLRSNINRKNCSHESKMFIYHFFNYRFNFAASLKPIMNKFWKIWIDTGGTFTDCLAHDPVGKLLKLLKF